MFQRIRRNVNVTSVVAVLALVFAMSGGAYAASRYVIASTKQISPKVLKALKGASGTSGATGPAGSVGPAGPAGSTGPAGGQGPQGAKGEPGPKGPQGEPGKPGENGQEGSPWTAGGTLPSGQSEYGQWAFSDSAAGAYEAFATAALSFPIPLRPQLPDVADAYYIGLEEGEGEPRQSSDIPVFCGGTVANPTAVSGDLCIFAAEATNLLGVVPFDSSQTGVEAFRHGKTGAGINAFSKAAGAVSGHGTWVVTAE